MLRNSTSFIFRAIANRRNQCSTRETDDDSDSEIEIDTPLPTLQRFHANRRPTQPTTTPSAATLITATHCKCVPTQYKLHPFLTRHKIVAESYIDNVQQKADVYVPRDIAQLCIAYSFVYDDGLHQLSQSLMDILGEWNQNTISKQIICTLISNFFAPSSKHSKRCVSTQQIEAYYCELVQREHLLVLDLLGDGSFIGVCGKAPHSRLRYCKLTE